GGSGAMVAGGEGNSASGRASLAAGHYAYADHRGSFVWADTPCALDVNNSCSTAFHSTGINQFCVRASGGVRLDSSTSLYFGAQTRQIMTLWDNGVNATFGIGVQPSTFYERAGAGSGFAWYS